MTDLRKKPRLIRGFFLCAICLWRDVTGSVVTRCIEHLRYVIDDRLTHILQKMRRPGMPVGVTNHGGVRCEKFGDVEQVGGVGEGLDDRDAGVDAEQRLVAVVGERGEADGFQVLGVGHWAPPVFGRWWGVTIEAVTQILDGSIAGISKNS